MGRTRIVPVVSMLAAALALLAPAGAQANEVFVSSLLSESLSLFSTTANGSLSQISCGASCHTASFPNGVAVGSDGRFLYVVENNNAVSPFAINADGSITPLNCPGASCNMSAGGVGLAISPDGRFLYTADFIGAVSPFAIKADGTLSPIPCPAMGCVAPSGAGGVAMSPNGRFLYVAGGPTSSPGTVAPFAVHADGSLAPIACGSACTVGKGPEQLTVTPDGRFLYVANTFGDSISPFTIKADGSLAPIACPGATCDAGPRPDGMTPSPNGRFLYVADAGGVSVSPFAIKSDGSLTPIPCSDCGAGANPDSLAVSPNGRSLYAVNGGSNSVSPFAINSDGSLTPIACPGTDCNTGQDPGFQSIAITPDQSPTAAFAASAGPAGKPARFDGSASSASTGQTVARYDWSFGDGQSAANGGPAPRHTYSKPGTYRVSLTVTDDAGCSAAQVYLGQMASCNGGPSARVTHPVTIAGPPNTKIKGAQINSKKGSATFEFKAKGTAKRFQCSLGAKHKKPRFRKCTSPKTYMHLRPGRYTFEVRAIGAAGPDPSPAKRRFKVG